jgi:quercetin dioxygenase-like cupin family protein
MRASDTAGTRNAIRKLSIVWTAYIALASGSSLAQVSPNPEASGNHILSQPGVFPFDQLPVTRMENGGESRPVVHGSLVTGEAVALHESMLPVGSAPTHEHRIEHSEFITVLNGTLAFEHDGKSEQVGPGGVIFVAVNVLHKLRNVGDVPAKYVVIAIGGDIKK